MESPANIRMIVIDIDGTLLTPEGAITAPTLAAVQAALQSGIVVTLATARRYCNTSKIADELGLDTSLILYDGAMARLQMDDHQAWQLWQRRIGDHEPILFKGQRRCRTRAIPFYSVRADNGNWRQQQ